MVELQDLILFLLVFLHLFFKNIVRGKETEAALIHRGSLENISNFPHSFFKIKGYVDIWFTWTDKDSKAILSQSNFIRKKKE